MGAKGSPVIKPIIVNCGERGVQFQMDLDPSFPADAAISWYLQNATPPEPEVVYLMSRVVHPGDLVIDAGANIGFFTLLLSQYVGSDGVVLAIEPSWNNTKKLYRNIVDINKAQNIIMQPTALADCEKTIPFFMGRDSGQNAAWRNEVNVLEETTVKAVSLDSIWLDRAVPKLIKMDIEGSELAALHGAKNLLALQPQFIVMEFNVDALKGMGTSPDEIREYMGLYDYNLYILSGIGGFPTRVPSDAKIKVDRNNTNVLFSTDESLLTEWPEISL